MSNMDQEEEMIDEIEDDEVIVLEGDNQDFIDHDMMQYFERAVTHIPGESINQDPIKDKAVIGINEDLEGVCRICLGEEDEPMSNPLFSPCKCAGSMGLIHLECLREWLKSKKI